MLSALNGILPTQAVRFWTLLASFLLAFFSLWLPAAQFHEYPGYPALNYTGWTMFGSSLFGWTELNFALLANPFLLIGWFLIARQLYRRAAIFLALAALCALEIFQLKLEPFSLPFDNAVTCYLTHPLIGWYLWFAAILLPFAAAIHFFSITAKPLPPSMPETT